MLAQQLCGINSVIMYSVSFLSELLPPTATGLITVGVGALNLVVTILCAPLADKLGRKLCLLISIAGMGLNTLLLAIAILFGVKILSGVATLLIVAAFGLGLGPIPFILANELVGPEAVGATQSLALAANWIAVFIVAQFFPILNLAMGKGKVFFLFAGVAAVSFAFVAWFVPETKGKTADEAWGRAERRVD
jgi:MFS family permease